MVEPTGCRGTDQGSAITPGGIGPRHQEAVFCRFSNCAEEGEDASVASKLRASPIASAGTDEN